MFATETECLSVVKEKYVYDVSVTVLHPLINKLKTVFPIPPQNPSHPQRLELTREEVFRRSLETDPSRTVQPNRMVYLMLDGLRLAANVRLGMMNLAAA
jgi:hypothetical protein